VSNASRTLSRARTALVALSLAAMIPAATAAAAPPDELVDRCLNRIAQTTQRTADAIAGAGAVGVNKIETLDAEDKPVPVMRRVARRASLKIEKSEIQGARQVVQTSEKCLRVLSHHEADPALAAMIIAARAQSIEAIHTASVNAHGAVLAGLEAALEDEELPAEDDALTTLGLDDPG